MREQTKKQPDYKRIANLSSCDMASIASFIDKSTSKRIHWAGFLLSEAKDGKNRSGYFVCEWERKKLGRKNYTYTNYVGFLSLSGKFTKKDKA